MATIRKRTNDDGSSSFQVQIRLKGFKPVTDSFARLTDAKQWAQKTEAAMREGRFFPERAAAQHTIADLVDRYVRDVELREANGDVTRLHFEAMTETPATLTRDEAARFD